MLKQAESLEQQAETSEQEALNREEEAAKQERILQLEAAVKDLQERIQAANNGKPLRGLPEARKRPREDDVDSVATNDSQGVTEEIPGKSMKIPKKQPDMSSCFNAVDERVTYVPGWHPIPRGSGLLITMPKSFKEKIWRNEFFSYRELHRVMTRPKTSASTSLKSIFDKLIEEDISVPQEKDSMRLLELNIYQLQFFSLYSQMYAQHAVSHMEHQLTLYTLIQQRKPLVQVLDYDDHVRKHFIRQIGEAWVSSDPVFTRLADAILANTRYDQDRHQKKHQNNQNFQNKHKPPKQFHKQKPKVAGSGTGSLVCFAYNGMSKNASACTRSNCPYQHKCANCKGPHRKLDCDKVK